MEGQNEDLIKIPARTGERERERRRERDHKIQQKI